MYHHDTSDILVVLSMRTDAMLAGVSTSSGDSISDISVARVATRMASNIDRAQRANFCAILRSKLALAGLMARTCDEDSF